MPREIRIVGEGGGSLDSGEHLPGPGTSWTPRSPEEKEVWEVLRRVKASEEPMCVTLKGSEERNMMIVWSIFGMGGVYPAYHGGALSRDERLDRYPGEVGWVRLPCGREIPDRFVHPKVPLGVDAVVLERHHPRIAEFRAIVAMQALGVGFFTYKDRHTDVLVPATRIRHVVVTECTDGPFTASAEPIPLTIETVRAWI